MTTQPTEGLKPCPFCGGQAELNHNIGSEVYDQSWQVRCTNCGVATGKAYGSNSWEKRSSQTAAKDAWAEVEAVKAWNTRASQEQPHG